MKKIGMVFLLASLFTASIYGQAQESEEVYSAFVKEAWDLYESKEYLSSATTYAKAFAAMGDKGRGSDRYNAACSWALAQEIDSSFVQLFRITKKGNYSNYTHISTDVDLTTLHSDSRWKEILTLVQQNKEKIEDGLEKPLVAQLDSIHQEDQLYRKQLREIEQKYGRDSDEIKAQWASIDKKDSINLIKITKILDERGWLGADVIGTQGNSTLFLVIQHADVDTQKKYLPMMREASKDGRAQPSSLALLEDRVALRSGEKQIYGSQIGRDPETGVYFVSPMIDPDKVDERRATVGLGSIASYIKQWNLGWDVEAYKKQMEAMQAKEKE